MKMTKELRGSPTMKYLTVKLQQMLVEVNVGLSNCAQTLGVRNPVGASGIDASSPSDEGFAKIKITSEF